jgi:hypothetical protein
LGHCAGASRIVGFWLAAVTPDYAMESWKQKNLVHQGGEGTQDRGKGKNLELMNSRKEVMKESSFSLPERTP